MLPQKYRKDPPYQVSYDWSDVRDGTGYAVFYGGSMNGTTYTSPNAFYSGMIHKNGIDKTLAVQSTYYNLLDFDWDIIFNIPKDVYGDILVSVPFGFYFLTGDGDTMGQYAECLVYHYDGTTETQIGSTATSETIQKANVLNHETFSHMTTFKINASTVQHFKAGETLRITIKTYAINASAANTHVIGGIGCNPINTTDKAISISTTDQYQVIITNDPTQLKFQVPFKTP
ncbi:MAG: hypothetical protein WC479_09940 [Candidatus Izemoplasmatales bacterium]|jgi:hypothetical protein